MKTSNNYVQRVYNALRTTDAISVMQPRIIRMKKRLNAIESVAYTEQDLRGLSKREKEFIRNNNYKCYIDLWQYSSKTSPQRYYVFIDRDLASGRKKIYAYSKRQYVNYSGHDINPLLWNYSCWLIIDLHYNINISQFKYERRDKALAPFPIS